MTEMLMSTSHAARYARVSVTTIQNWIEKGWLRVETEGPVRLAEGELVDAIATARRAPRRPMSIQTAAHHIRRGVQSALDIEGCRAAESLAAVLLDIAELSPYPGLGDGLDLGPREVWDHSPKWIQVNFAEAWGDDPLDVFRGNK